MPLFTETALDLKLTFAFTDTHTPFLICVPHGLKKPGTLEEVIVEQEFFDRLRHIVSETGPQTATSSSPGPHTLSLITPFERFLSVDEERSNL